jgi:hypothetical protein
MDTPSADEEPLAERAQRRLAVPVIVAAVVSVPAVFLTTLDGAAGLLGRVLNWFSLAVLIGEAVLLFLLSRNRVEWLRTHKWLVFVVALTVPAVVFAVGPAQLLRLVRLVGTLRVLRAGRILKAGRVLQRRLEPNRRWSQALLALVSVTAATFVTLVLVDPTSSTRQLIRLAGERWTTALAVLAALLLFGATIVVLRRRRGDHGENGHQADESVGDGQVADRQRVGGAAGRLPKRRC